MSLAAGGHPAFADCGKVLSDEEKVPFVDVVGCGHRWHFQFGIHENGDGLPVAYEQSGETGGGKYETINRCDCSYRIVI